MKKILIGSAIALALVAGTASAATTVADIDALIAQLMQQKAALSGGTSAAAFSTDLTVGSTGADVVRLQTWLESQGHLTMPAGVAKGYFGPLTKAAVAKYQAASGITPALGYFGPITRGKVNAMAATPATPATPGTPGTPATPATPATPSIATPGAEGTLTVTSGPISGSTVYEGQTMVPVIAFKAEAKNSDIAVQRVKLNLGTSSTIYNKIYDKIYVTDGSNVLASADLNSSTVVKEGSTYYITLVGFNYVVAKNTIKTLTIKADVRNTVDTGDLGSYTITIPELGIRGVDGAGVDQYSPSTGSGTITKSITISADLVDSASLKLSTNSNNVKTNDVIAASGSDEDEYDNLTTLIFDVKAEKDAVTITDLAVTTAKTGTGAATATTAYLYDGSTLIDSASVNATTGVATFSNIDYVVSRDQTKSFSIKVDVRDANGTAATLTTTITSGQITAENSRGDSVTPSGSATGEGMIVRNVGPVITLVGTPTITKALTPSQNDVSTSTATSVFNLNIKAVGGDLYFGTQSASTTFAFNTYVGGTATTLLVSSSTSWSIPSSGVVTSGLQTGQAFKLQENNEVTIPVTYIFEGRVAATSAFVATNSYAAGLENVKWSTTGNDSTSSTFMSGKTEWRTATVQLP